MADWQNRIELYHDWERAHSGEITTQQLASIVADRLSKCTRSLDEELRDERDDIADEFLSMADDDTLSIREFDAVLERLYDWADTPLDGNRLGGRKVCWVNTLLPPREATNG